MLTERNVITITYWTVIIIIINKYIISKITTATGIGIDTMSNRYRYRYHGIGSDTDTTDTDANSLTNMILDDSLFYK